jgi:hypothetical protein
MKKIREEKPTPEMNELGLKLADDISDVINKFIPDDLEDKEKIRIYIIIVRSILLQITIDFHQKIKMEKSIFLAHANITWDNYEKSRKEKE